MGIVILTALGVGLSTVAGSAAAMLFKKSTRELNDAILSFAAGVMLGASFLCLILPSLEADYGYVPVICGIFAGAVFISAIDRFVPRLKGIAGVSGGQSNARLEKILLFLIAVAIHNFPEGIAVGVSFGSGDAGNAFAVAAGISLHNFPEGIITVMPLTLAGVRRTRAMLIALFTGLTEAVGVMLGYFAVSFAEGIMPFVLSFAAGTMLSVVCNELIPETHGEGHGRLESFSLVAGISVMILVEKLL